MLKILTSSNFHLTNAKSIEMTLLSYKGIEKWMIQKKPTPNKPYSEFNMCIFGKWPRYMIKFKSKSYHFLRLHFFPFNVDKFNSNGKTVNVPSRLPYSMLNRHRMLLTSNLDIRSAFRAIMNSGVYRPNAYIRIHIFSLQRIEPKTPPPSPCSRR